MKKLEKQDFTRITITTIFGSWCHDSHQQLPRFIRILKQVNYPIDQMKMFALDTYKKAAEIDSKALDIQYVPTFIIYRNNKGIGRIIETPKRNLEKDLLQIIVKN